jgi:hypothetical protein
MAKGKSGKRKAPKSEKKEAPKEPPKSFKKNTGIPPWLFSRWIIVVAAILIQLSLGAIYAWSVFTPSLSAPLPDDDFKAVSLDDDITVVKAGALKSGTEKEITLTFTEGNTTITDLNVSVSLELRDTDNKVIKSDKIIPYIGYKYEEGKPITAGPYNLPADHNYTFKSKVTKAGNWHYLITATEKVGNDTNTYTFELIDKVGTGTFGFTITQTQMIFAVGLLPLPYSPSSAVGWRPSLARGRWR